MKKMPIILFVVTAIFLVSCGGGGQSEEAMISKVYANEEGHAILYDTPLRTGNVVVSDEKSQFWLLSTTTDNSWAIIGKAPSEVGEGRIETEQLLYYLPESRLIDFGSLNPPLTVFEMSFESIDGVETLVAVTGGDYENVNIPLAGLLRGELPGNTAAVADGGSQLSSEAAGALTATAGNEATVVELKLGTGDNEIGQGGVERQTEGGRFIYAIPSFAASDNSLYIIDAINFRILVSDYAGTITRNISYPQALPGRSTLVARDIALDNEYIYLLSVYENAVYVIDKATEDIATIIEGTGASGKKFGDLRSVQTDHAGSILLFDANDNTVYSFRRNKADFSLVKTTPYKQPGQLVPAADATIYAAEPADKGFRLISDGGLSVTVACKHPVGAAEVLATDIAGNIYVKVTEEESGAQFWGPVTVRVVSPEGVLIRTSTIRLWTNGPMERNLVVDKSGILFESAFDGMPDDEDWPATKLVIKRY